MAIDIVDLPIKEGVFPYLFRLPEGIISNQNPQVREYKSQTFTNQTKY